MKLKQAHSAMPFALATLPIAAIFGTEKVVPYILLVLAALAFFEKGKCINFKNNKIILTPFLAAFMVYLVYALLSPDIPLALKVLERQISLLLLPFLIVLAHWDIGRVALFFKIFILLILATGACAILKFVVFLVSNADWIDYMATESGSRLLYLQYKFPHIMGTHPTYWSYLLISGLILLWHNGKLKIFKKRAWTIGLIVFFNVILVLLASRTALFINTLLHILFFYQYLKQKSLGKIKKMAIIALVGAAILTLTKVPLLAEKIEAVKTDERIYHWPLAIKTIHENYFILGEGLGQGNEVIKKDVLTNGDTRVRYKGYDLHNQYLRHYLDMGLLGFASLIFLLSFSMFGLNGEMGKSYSLQLCFFLFFALALMTEAFLYRLKGIVFFATLMTFLCLHVKGFKETASRR